MIIDKEILIGSTRVIVDYTMDKNGPMEWRDALHFSIEEWPNQTPVMLEEEMHRRHDNWIALITAPPVPVVELTPDELQVVKP